MKTGYYLAIYMLVISVSVVKAEEVLIDKIPSEEFREIARNAPSHFLELDISIEKHISVFTTAIVGTLQGVSSGDDRAHNAALAIDLYNSIPPS